MSNHPNHPARPAEGNFGPGGALSEEALQRYLDGRMVDAELSSTQDQLKNEPAARRMLDALREEDVLL